jgi:hypothetical protein
MGMGDLRADCSARTHHRLNENAWLQHFDLLSGPPIEIVWAWVIFEQVIVLKPITIECTLSELLEKNVWLCNLRSITGFSRQFVWGISEQKLHSLSRSIN